MLMRSKTKTKTLAFLPTPMPSFLRLHFTPSFPLLLPMSSTGGQVIGCRGKSITVHLCSSFLLSLFSCSIWIPSMDFSPSGENCFSRFHHLQFLSREPVVAWVPHGLQGNTCPLHQQTRASKDKPIHRRQAPSANEIKIPKVQDLFIFKYSTGSNY